MWQVDPPATTVFSDVAKNVGELVRDAEGDSRITGVRRITPGSRGVSRVNPHHLLRHQPHRSRNAVAVELQVVEARVAGGGQVHPHPLDHVEIGLQRLGVALEGVDHHAIETVLDFALEEGAGALLPAIEAFGQLRDGTRHRLGAIHQFVGAAAPDVNGPNRPALGRGHQQGAQIKGLGPLRRFLATGFKRVLKGGDGGEISRCCHRRHQAATAVLASLTAWAQSLPLSTAPSIEAR